jgi:hypothetical protein
MNTRLERSCGKCLLNLLSVRAELGVMYRSLEVDVMEYGTLAEVDEQGLAIYTMESPSVS